MQPLPQHVPVTCWVFKIVSRCNLRCTYCYMYEGVDQNWVDLPVLMPRHIATAAAKTVCQVALSQGDKSATIALHGGEPMLAPPAYLGDFFLLTSQILGRRGLDVEFRVQTNATALSDASCQLLAEVGAFVSVSVDGTRAAHDRRRITVGGRGSYEHAMAGIERLRNNGVALGQVLAVIDFSVPPAEFLGSLFELGFQTVDVMLPYATHDDPPSYSDEEMSEWLIEAFDFALSDHRSVGVRTFDTLLKLAFGGIWGLDTWGALVPGTLIVDTDGRLLASDALRLTDSAPTDFSNQELLHDVDGLRSSPAYTHMTQPLTVAPPVCRGCRVRHLCGNGHMVERHSRNFGYNHASVYCKARFAFLSYVTALADRTGQGL